MCWVWFFSLLFRVGIIRLMVFVVLVVCGIMFFVVVLEVCRFFLCGLFISDWVLVQVWMVVMVFMVMLKVFCRILVIGVRQLVVQEVMEMMVLFGVRVLLLMLQMMVFILLVGVEISILCVLVWRWVCDFLVEVQNLVYFIIILVFVVCYGICCVFFLVYIVMVLLLMISVFLVKLMFYGKGLQFELCFNRQVSIFGEVRLLIVIIFRLLLIFNK